MYYIYILKSFSTGKRYTGHTSNLLARLNSHNSGDTPSTKNRGPWEIIYTEEYSSRSEAMKREKFLKTGKGREFLKSILNEI
jgi:putative endonuclease